MLFSLSRKYRPIPSLLFMRSQLYSKSDNQFSSENYNSILYRVARPGYPDRLFDVLYEFHAQRKGQHKIALDVGTGNGQAALFLSNMFEKVIGVDSSDRQLSEAHQVSNIQYVQSDAENMSFLTDNSVDLVTCAQCIHWFDLSKFFAELKRILKVNTGTFAAWMYDLVVVRLADRLDPVEQDDPMNSRYEKAHAKLEGQVYRTVCEIPAATTNEMKLNQLLRQHAYEILGPYWDSRRSIVERLYLDIHPPFLVTERNTLIMAQSITVASFLLYLKTWSSYKTYRDQHPNRPDPVDELVERMNQLANISGDSVITVYYPIYMLLCSNQHVAVPCSSETNVSPIN